MHAANAPARPAESTDSLHVDFWQAFKQHLTTKIDRPVYTRPQVHSLQTQRRIAAQGRGRNSLKTAPGTAFVNLPAGSLTAMAGTLRFPDPVMDFKNRGGSGRRYDALVISFISLSRNQLRVAFQLHPNGYCSDLVIYQTAPKTRWCTAAKRYGYDSRVRKREPDFCRWPRMPGWPDEIVM